MKTRKNLSEKKLTKREEKLLLETPEDAFTLVFPKHKRDFLRREKRRILREQSVEEKLKKDFEYRTHKQTMNEFKKKLDFLMGENLQLKNMLEAQTKMKKQFKTTKIEPKTVSGVNEATAVVLLSDWHIDETVEAIAVNHVNRFDYSIAETRAKQTFQTIVRMIGIHQRDIDIHNLILWLGGDFISSMIHEDLQESNSMLPMEAVWKAQNLLASGIKFILDNSDVSITIPCSPGNHSRITKKQRISTEHENSLETLMYRNLAFHFQDNPRVSFIMDDSYHTYIEVYGYVLRFHHGHAMKYGGGIGGLFIPVYKAISQWNKIRTAYLDCFGHFHQKKDGGNFICNGSLIGFNAYAISIKADFDKPCQTFFLIDKKRGKTVVAPIILNGS